MLTASGIVRSDVTSSFGSSTTKATGVPLAITMRINEFDNDKKPLAGAAVYVWHSDQAGQYCLYSQTVVNENYLRGVQETDTSGNVRFTTIFPACYSGRWPHIHFEVCPSLAKAVGARQHRLQLRGRACGDEVPLSGHLGHTSRPLMTG